MRPLHRSAVVAFLFAASLAHADDEPLPHEFVPDLEADEGMLIVSSDGGQPDAIVSGGEVIERPPLERMRANGRPMLGGAGDGRRNEEPGRRSASFRPDRVTHLNGNVGYYAVFSPTIAPFKRVTALDRVVLADDGAPILTIADRHRASVHPVGATAASPNGLPRDRFWGSLVVDVGEGSTVPLPSVAPDSRILTIDSDPPSPVTVHRDRADNFYVSIEATDPRRFRLVFLTDAPRSYFGRSIPDGTVGVLADQLAPLPPSVQRDAMIFAQELGLSQRSSFREALTELTRYFRSFEESVEPPSNRGNIYLDLARGRRGICRHRAYAFVITAQALGMHARFVQNEAHAWVEVELPADGGWLRVDLGGAATGLEAHGAANRPRYEPDVQDSLPRPDEYQRAYEQARQMGGLRQPRAAPGGTGPGAASASGAGGDASGTSSPQPSAPLSSARGVLALRLDTQRYEVFRGREIAITGSARGGGQPIEGLRVEMGLRTPGGEREWLLGVTVTDASGRFRALLGVPPDLAVGDYRLLVRSPGNDTWSSAVAR